jgi:lambda family phage tail tape measure protein
MSTDLAQIKIEVVVNGVPDAAGRLRSLDSALNSGRNAAAGLASRFADGNRAAQGLLGTLNQIKGAVAGYVGMRTLFDIGSTSMNLASVESAFRSITGSADAARETMSWLREESQRLGLDFLSLTDGFKGFSAAGKAAGLSGESVRSVFTDISEAAVSLQLDGLKTERVFYALEQMLSKGTVSMEELRQQMGESMPGAFTIAAHAMGKTEQEFAKLVEQGQVLSRDFVLKFAPAIRDAFGSGFAEALQTPRAELQRLCNELTLAAEEIGKAGFLQGLSGGAKELRQALQTDELRASLRQLGATLGEIAGALARTTAFFLEHADALQAVIAFYAAYKVSLLALGVAKGQLVTAVRSQIAAEAQAHATALAAAQADLAVAQADHAVALAKMQTAESSLAKARAEWAECEIAGAMIGITNQQVAAYQRLIAAEVELRAAKAGLITSGKALEEALARISLAGTGANRALTGLKAVGAGIMNFFGGPVGLAITAAAGSLFYFSTRQDESEKVAAKYHATMDRVRTSLLGAAAGAKEAEKEITATARAMAAARWEKDTESMRKLRDEIKLFDIGAASGWKKPEAVQEGIAGIKELQEDLRLGKITAREFVREVGDIHAAVKESGQGTKGFTLAVDELLQKAVSAVALGEEIDNHKRIMEGLPPIVRELAEATGQAAREMENLDWAVKAVEKLSDLRLRLTLSKEGYDAKQLADDVAEYNRAIEALAQSKKIGEAAAASLDMSLLKAGAKGYGASDLKSWVQERESIAEKLKEIEMGEVAYKKLLAEQKYDALVAGLQGEREALVAQQQILASRLVVADKFTEEELKIYRERAAALGEQVASIDLALERMAANRGKLLQGFAGGGSSAGSGAAAALRAVNDELARLTMTEEAYNRLKFDQKIEEYRKAGVAVEKLRELTEAWTQAEQGKKGEKNAQVLVDFEKEYLTVMQGNEAAQIASIRERAKAYEEAGVDAARVAQWQAEEELRYSRDATAGMALAFKDYALEATNAAKDTGQLVNTICSGMEDSLTQFCLTGKLEFRSLADSIIADLMRIAVRQTITGPLASGLSSALGSLFGGAGGGGSAPVMSGFSTDASGYGWLSYNAKGNVFSGAGINALSNGYVDKPTFFGFDQIHAFAKGVGVAGEAGPEAILPLERIGGSLGVNARVAAPAADVRMTVHIHNNANARVTAEESTDAGGMPRLDVFIDPIDQAIAQRINQGRSHTGAALARNYGLNRDRQLYGK